ncbi:hypothetical protein QR680_000287 [Steinernema hermaphroditum]|uniref:Uncharacterized protein n=1 Tax=Steinernema hermaphroditum TaxID=289476 RepID=A0AA39GW43_9BILA|nr:hypothetical protein QR680_000287 [Steinernema hermaphroditum]
MASSSPLYLSSPEPALPELLTMTKVRFLKPILFLALLSVAVFISSDIYVLVNYLSFAETSVVLMVAGHLKLRATRPFLKRFTCKNR